MLRTHGQAQQLSVPFCKCAAAQLLLLDCSELFKDFARDNCSSPLGILHRLVLQVLCC